MKRTLCLVALLQAGCSLDFDALERGRGDAGGLDAHVDRDDVGAVDAGAVDAGRDAPAVDAELPVDAGHDAFVADAGVDAAAAPDGGHDAGSDGGHDAGSDAFAGCPTPVDCNLPACRGASCDDGLVCTSGDVCTPSGACAGTPITCPANECATTTCSEPAGCHVTSSRPDGTTCTGGRCCYGRCSNLHDSGNCAGCGLGCDEYSCDTSSLGACVCDTNAGCPNGQQCVAHACVCTTNAQCAAGQTCVGNHCSY